MANINLDSFNSIPFENFIMNEITSIIDDYSLPNAENTNDIELHSSQEQIDSGLDSLKISMIQIRQILNVLNSQFYNSSNSISDISQTSIRFYYELFQTVAKGLKPIESAIQNPNLVITTSKNKFEKLYFKFITDFVELILTINLPKEVFNPICNFFSPLLVIFIRNLINEKTNILLEDFTLIVQLNQGSFAVFESIIKNLFTNSFYKLDLIYDLIHEDGNDSNNDADKVLNENFEELKKSLIWTEKSGNQSQTILNSIFTIRCEILSRRCNKIKLSTLLNEIETSAKICISYNNAKESLNEFIEYLNYPNLKINVSTHFTNCIELQSFYEKINKFQLLELNKLLEDDLISLEFAEEMKTILENVFDYKENSILDNVFSLVDTQLYNYHHCPPDQEETKDEEDQIVKSKKMKKEEYDLKLQKMIPPTNYDQTIETFLEFIRDPEIGGEIPLTLEKDMMTLQITEIISVFKKDKLNHPIKDEIDFLEEVVNELSFLMNKAVDISYSSDNHKCSIFLSVYIATIKVLLIAKDKYKKSDDDFQPILHTFFQLVPPSSYIMKILNINERFQNLQQASKLLMETVSQSSLFNYYNENGGKEADFFESDKTFNEEKISLFGSNEAANKLIFELDLASHILLFIEKNQKFLELIGCTDLSADLWQEDADTESSENVKFFEENNINASLSLLSLFYTEGFYFDITPDFFINWITFNFSTLNKNIHSIPLIEFIPFCDFSELLGSIINSCTLVDLYSRINGTENATNLINATETLKYSMLIVFSAHRLDEVYLTKQVQTCIKESRNFPNVFKKINVLCHSILTKICSYIKIFDFTKYVRILNPTKVSSIVPIETINYSIEILKKLKLISQSKCLPPEFLEMIEDVGQKLTSIVIPDPESRPLPPFFSPEMEKIMSNVYSVLNEVRKVVDTFDITTIASQVSTYIDEILIYYETQQDQSSESNKSVFSSEDFNAIYALKEKVDELVFANKIINAEVSIVKMQLILEKAESIFPKLDKPLAEFYEMINISYTIFAIKTMLNLVYFSISQYTKNGITVENWFEGEFDENFIFCKEDENIDMQFTNLMECINSLSSGMTDLQSRINSVSSENSNLDQDPSSRNYNPQLMMRSKLVKDINSSFQILSNTLKSKLARLNNRKISPEVPQLEKECNELIQQYSSYPNQTQNLPIIFKSNKLKILPSSNQLVTQFESQQLQLSLKNITIKEMENKIEILQEELNKRQNQIDQSIDSDFIDSKKKQRERSNQIIELIKQSISNPNKITTTTVNEGNDENKDEVSADDENYEIIQKLKKQINDLDQENLKLKNEIREIEFHHKISREDQIDLLMDKSCSFPNPSIPNGSNEKISGTEINKKDNEFLSKQVKELNESIEKMKKKIQTDKKQGSNEANIIKLFKDIRPRLFPETLVNEDVFKQVTKSTRERADKVMKEWRTLRADLDSHESGM